MSDYDISDEDVMTSIHKQISEAEDINTKLRLSAYLDQPEVLDRWKASTRHFMKIDKFWSFINVRIKDFETGMTALRKVSSEEPMRSTVILTDYDYQFWLSKKFLLTRLLNTMPGSGIKILIHLREDSNIDEMLEILCANPSNTASMHGTIKDKLYKELENCVHNEDPTVRIRTLASLTILHPLQGHGVAIDMLLDDDESIRCYAAALLNLAIGAPVLGNGYDDQNNDDQSNDYGLFS